MRKTLFEERFEGMLVSVVDEEGQRLLLSDGCILHSRSEVLCNYQQGMVDLYECSSPPKRCLHLGLGGGSLITYYHKLYPTSSHIAVEKCPFMPKIAHRFFNLPQSRGLTIHIADAYAWCIESLENEFDLILLDVCDTEGPITKFYHLSFIDCLKKKLNPSGVLLTHLWASTLPFKKAYKCFETLFPRMRYLALSPSHIAIACYKEN